MTRLFPNYPEYIITSPFGERIHPVTGKKQMHNGIDLVATKGAGGCTDYITAHTGGVVEQAGYNDSCGYYVNIRVNKDTIMVYYHMANKPYVAKGTTVEAGTTLGYMGSTGTATGAHLHWGIKKNGAWIDPEPYLYNDYTGPIQLGGSIASTKGENTVKVEMNVLKKGSKGEQVKTLQRLLLAMGYNLGGYGVDGSFGGATEKAVKEYQKEKGLSVDGSVGQNTWNKLLKG